ncbi:hypothetical protein ACX0G7_09905 [Flavitalea antarctica]
MKLTQQAILALTPRGIRLRLALELNFSELWINKLITQNKENGALTTAKAIEVIQSETGLSNDEILEKEHVNA